MAEEEWKGKKRGRPEGQPFQEFVLKLAAYAAHSAATAAAQNQDERKDIIAAAIAATKSATAAATAAKQKDDPQTVVVTSKTHYRFPPYKVFSPRFFRVRSYITQGGQRVLLRPGKSAQAA